MNQIKIFIQEKIADIEKKLLQIAKDCDPGYFPTNCSDVQFLEFLEESYGDFEDGQDLYCSGLFGKWYAYKEILYQLEEEMRDEELRKKGLI